MERCGGNRKAVSCGEQLSLVLRKSPGIPLFPVFPAVLGVALDGPVERDHFGGSLGAVRARRGEDEALSGTAPKELASHTGRLVVGTENSSNGCARFITLQVYPVATNNR